MRGRATQLTRPRATQSGLEWRSRSVMSGAGRTTAQLTRHLQYRIDELCMYYGTFVDSIFWRLADSTFVPVRRSGRGPLFVFRFSFSFLVTYAVLARASRSRGAGGAEFIYTRGVVSVIA